jgi:DNA-binding CsgD family transcriptional regulator
VLDLHVQALKAVLAAAAAPAAAPVRVPLSGTQVTFLRWAAEGKSSSDIASITGTSRRTVDYHFAEILRKLEVSTGAQAVAWLARAGRSGWGDGGPEPAASEGRWKK